MRAIVYYNGTPAGELTKNPDGYTFAYFDDYVANGDLPAVSLTLPKKKEPYKSKTLFPFFFGLLSEGENKEILCKALNIGRDDYFRILTETAALETIGAITVSAA